MGNRWKRTRRGQVVVQEQLPAHMMNKQVVKFEGVLSKEELAKFLLGFKELDVSQTTVVTEVEVSGGILVTLSNDTPVNFLLATSFEDGLLNHWGWTDKFKQVQ